MREYDRQLGQVRVVASLDPIEVVAAQMKPEALVSCDDSRLSMSRGVAVGIAKIAGRAMVKEARRHAPALIGTVITTSAGVLDTRYIFHAITADWKRLILPTDRTIRALASEVFVRCEALRIRSVAIPALGTGAGGFPPERSATLIVESLLEHLRHGTTLQTVIVSLPLEEVHREFVEYLAAVDATLSEITAREAESMETVLSVQLEDDHERVGGLFLRARSLDRDARQQFLEKELGAEPRLRAEVEALLAQDRELEERRIPLAAPRAARWWPTRGGFGGSRRRADQTTAPRSKSEDHPLLTSGAVVVPRQDSRRVLNERYVLLEEIGRGGMARVNLAWDLVLRRVVAIKVLRRDLGSNARATELLRQEASVAIDLTHDAIVRVYHFEPRHEIIGPFLVMEYLAWPSGEKWIADAGDRHLPVDSVIDIGVQLCDALSYAHHRGVLHGDVKPSNVFVDAAAERVKLGDFGLSRILAESTRRTMQLGFAGTPAYMAPEQRSVGVKVGPSADIYQLAATLWDFLTGRPPSDDRPHSLEVDTGRKRALEVAARGLAEREKDRPGARDFGKMLQAVGP